MMEDGQYALLKAVKEDSLKDFNALIEQDKSLLYVRFGRFPLLSLCYLYESESIAEVVEPSLLGFSNYTVLSEDFDSYVKFRTVAKRSLRLFSAEKVVHPLEILAVTGQSGKLTKLYPDTPKSYKNVETIRLVYSLTYEQNIDISLDSITLQKGKLEKKQKILYISAFVTAFVMIALSLMAFWGFKAGFGGNGEPYKVRSARQFTLAMERNEDIILVRHITLTDWESLESYSGELDGNGRTLTVKTNAFITELNGKISNLSVELSPKTTLITESTGLLVSVNKGELSGVKVKVRSDFVTEFEEPTEEDYSIYLSTMVYDNQGTITDCHVDIVTHITGDIGFDTCFGAIAAMNSDSGYISGCSTVIGSKITADTADIAGIVSENSAEATLFGCTNNADLTQITNKANWLPNTAGIVMLNYGKATECINNGDIVSQSDYTITGEESVLEVYAGGIASINFNRIQKCLNRGEITAQSASFNVYSGGISAVSSGLNSSILACANYGTQNVYSDSGTVWMLAGGISAWCEGKVEKNYSMATLKGSENAYLGGIAGVVVPENSVNNLYLAHENILLGVPLILEERFDFWQGVYYWAIVQASGEYYGAVKAETAEEIKESAIYWG